LPSLRDTLPARPGQFGRRGPEGRRVGRVRLRHRELLPETVGPSIPVSAQRSQAHARVGHNGGTGESASGGSLSSTGDESATPVTAALSECIAATRQGKMPLDSNGYSKRPTHAFSGIGMWSWYVQPKASQTRSASSCADSSRFGSITRRLVCNHFGSIGLSQGLFTGKGQMGSRTPAPVALTCRLWTRIQARTSWLRCHEALSHTSRSAVLPWAAAPSQHQARKLVVTALTGRPSRKRSHLTRAQHRREGKMSATQIAVAVCAGGSRTPRPRPGERRVPLPHLRRGGRRDQLTGSRHANPPWRALRRGGGTRAPSLERDGAWHLDRPGPDRWLSAVGLLGDGGVVRYRQQCVEA